MYRKKNTMCKLRHMNRQSVTPNQPHAFRHFPHSLIAKILTHTIVHNPAIHMEQWDTYKNHRTHIHTLAKTLRHWNVLLRPQACVVKLPACLSEFPHVLKSKVQGHGGPVLSPYHLKPMQFMIQGQWWSIFLKEAKGATGHFKLNGNPTNSHGGGLDLYSFQSVPGSGSLLPDSGKFILV